MPKHGPTCPRGEITTANIADALPPLRIIRSRRRKRTVSIRVEPDGVVVRIPAAMSDEALQALLQRRREWLWETWRSVQTFEERPWYERPLAIGGEPVKLCFHTASAWEAERSAGCVTLAGPAPSIADPQVRVFAAQVLASYAGGWLASRLRHWSQHTGLVPSGVRIADPRSRWGSCSARGRIMLSWRLGLAPVAVADYVIVHELCHLLELNHSSRFWQHVERWIPDHAAHRRWLREHGHELHW